MSHSHNPRGDLSDPVADTLSNATSGEPDQAVSSRDADPELEVTIASTRTEETQAQREASRGDGPIEEEQADVP